jgi:hypothetical protein
MKKQYFNIEPSSKELTISGVEWEYFESSGRRKEMAVMSFRKTETLWIVSTTAFESLWNQIGTQDTGTWVGIRIRLRIDPRADVIDPEDL